MTEEQLEALTGRLDKLDNGLLALAEGVTSLHTAVADSRRDIGDKLAQIQEAIYYMAHKMLPPQYSEELRSMLPDPPKRRASFA